MTLSAALTILLPTSGTGASLSDAAGAQPAPFLSGNSKTNCIYPANSITDLAMLSSLTGTSYDCVLLFNDDKPDWQAWTNVWWDHPPSPGSDWLAWLASVPGRRLIISQPMVPNDAPSDWPLLGAEGAYDAYATQLAENLVNEGMGSSIIRLGWEANDPSNPENALPTSPSDYGAWAAYWANIVTAMRAVPGANFQFDWTVNQYYEPIPLADWYPGNEVVDIIGIDAYDSGIYQSGLTAQQRWQDLVNEKDGLAAVAAFAAQHAKPLSIAEWGLASPAVGGAGDDPTYVEGLGTFIADNDVEYNSYFYSSAPDNLIYLPEAPQSLTAYREYFLGATASSTLTSTSTTTAPSPGTLPAPPTSPVPTSTAATTSPASPTSDPRPTASTVPRSTYTSEAPSTLPPAIRTTAPPETISEPSVLPAIGVPPPASAPSRASLPSSTAGAGQVPATLSPSAATATTNASRPRPASSRPKTHPHGSVPPAAEKRQARGRAHSSRPTTRWRGRTRRRPGPHAISTARPTLPHDRPGRRPDTHHRSAGTVPPPHRATLPSKRAPRSSHRRLQPASTPPNTRPYRPRHPLR